jgi:hypothetical protein
MIQLTEKEKRYYKDNYSEVLTEGLELFKRCSPEVLTYIIETIDPMTDASNIMSRKTLLTMTAVAYAKSELMKEIIKERKRNECKINTKVETVKKFDLQKI